MIWGSGQVRRAFHPQALQVGHFAETYEFSPLDDFLSWLRTGAGLHPSLYVAAAGLEIDRGPRTLAVRDVRADGLRLRRRGADELQAGADGWQVVGARV